MLLLLMKPSPTQILGATLGMKLFDIIIFFTAIVMIAISVKKINGRLFRSGPFLFLLIMIPWEIVSFLHGSIFHSYGVEDSLEFLRWLMYMPLLILGFLGAGLPSNRLFASFLFAFLILTVFSWLLFFNVGELKAVASVLYDLDKSRGLENISSSVGLWRLSSTFANPNYFGVFLTIAFALLLAFGLLYKAFTLKIGLLILSTPLLIALTGSRTAMAALAATLIVFAMLAVRTALRNGRSWGLLAILFLLAALPYVVINGYQYLTENFWRFSNIDNISESLGGRTEAWGQALNTVYSRPTYLIFGYGSNKAEFQSLDNNYLTFFVKNGLVGVLLFLGFLGSLAHTAFSNILGRSIDGKFWGYSLLASVIVMSISSLTSIPFHHTQLAMFFFLVVGANVREWNP